MFKWPEDMSDKDVENMANAISGAFLFPISDMKRELGVRRSAITNDMVGVCKEYGISMYMLVMRANKSGIINDYVAKNFYINANKAGWRKNEPSRAPNCRRSRPPPKLWHSFCNICMRDDTLASRIYQ